MVLNNMIEIKKVETLIVKNHHGHGDIVASGQEFKVWENEFQGREILIWVCENLIGDNKSGKSKS